MHHWGDLPSSSSRFWDPASMHGSPQSGFHPERAWARDMLCCRLSRSVGLCLVFSLKPFQVPGADTKRIKAAAAAAAMPSSLPHALLDALSFS